MPDFMAPMTMKVGRRPSDRSVTSGSRPSLRSLLWLGGPAMKILFVTMEYPPDTGIGGIAFNIGGYGACDGRARPRGPRALVLARPGGPGRRRPWRARAPPAPGPHPRAAQGAARCQRGQAGRGGLVGVAGGEEARPATRRRQHPGLDGGGPDVLAHPRAAGRVLPAHAAAPDHRAQPAGAGLARASWPTGSSAPRCDARRSSPPRRSCSPTTSSSSAGSAATRSG